MPIDYYHQLLADKERQSTARLVSIKSVKPTTKRSSRLADKENDKDEESEDTESATTSKFKLQANDLTFFHEIDYKRAMDKQDLLDQDARVLCGILV